jgi:chromosomal replication initiator protein
MAKVDPTLWRQMMDYLRRKHPTVCRQWFDELQPIDLHAGLLRIHTGNGVQKNYLQNKCLDYFVEAAQNVTGALISVRFVTEQVEPNLEAPALVTGNLPTPTPENNGSPAAHTETRQPPAPAPTPAPSFVRRTPQGAADDPMANDQIVISPDYAFENFVTGPGNHLAYSASVAVANQPGKAYNPLFIHGGVGLGKTHLLQAICQEVLRKRPDMKICYISCDTFMNQFLECVQSGKMAEFRHRYRHVDMLVIDDIHFLADRERTQEEFFHTFNELYQSNRQIVLSSDSPPSEIPQLEDRLVSRFQWGMIAHVSKPCYETRVAIIKSKAKLRGIVIPEEVIAYIAQRLDSNARELEGAITTLQGHAVLQNQKIDLALAKAALGDSQIHASGSQVTLQNIISAVTNYYNVKLSDLQSKRRHKSITGPRQVCMWLARKRTRFSLEEIGAYFGGRDHTTVMHSIRIVEERMGQDPSFAAQIEKLDQTISNSVNAPAAPVPVAPAPAPAAAAVG